MISYIVSACDRPGMLRACVASLAVQEGEKQICVTLNGDKEQSRLNIEAVHKMNAMFSYTATYSDNAYDAALVFIETRGPMGKPMNPVKGDWLCFPSDDSLYVADFGKIMIEAAVREMADLVYCDMIYKQGSESSGWKPYSILESEPRMGKIDKTNFIIRRELFKGFPPHPRNWRDGALIEQVIRDGAKAAKAPGILVLHQ